MSFNATIGKVPGTMLSTMPETNATGAPLSTARWVRDGFFGFASFVVSVSAVTDT